MECTPVWFLGSRNCQNERTHSCTSICLFSGMSDSEVSPEAELGKTSAKHPQGDCLEAEEVLNEDVKEESVDGSKEDEDDEMYDIDIDTDEHTERKDGDVWREDGVSWSSHEEACTAAARMSGSVDDEEHRIKQEAETPEDREESHTELKVMFLSFWMILLGFVSVCGCFGGGGGGGLIPLKNIYFQGSSDKISMVLTGCIFFSLLPVDLFHICRLYSQKLYGKLQLCQLLILRRLL